MNIKLNFNKYTAFLTLILYPFFFPEGFENFIPIYKTCRNYYLYFSILLIIFFCIVKGNNLEPNTIRILNFTILYFLFIVIETLLVAGKFNEGFRKLFATPLLCIFIIICFNNSAKYIINALGNILIINMGLNCTLFNPIFFNRLVNVKTVAGEPSLIQFIGHVQSSVQIAALGLGIGVILRYINQKAKGNIILILSLITMGIAFTEASYFALALIVITYLFRKKLYKFYYHISFSFIFNFFIVLNCIVILYVLIMQIDFGARYQVWRPLIDQMGNHWIFGFGVYGTVIQPLWAIYYPKDIIAFNYAHNELLQLLIDGGIFLIIVFITYVNSLTNKVKIYDKTVCWIKIAFIILMMDSIFESVTEYNYFYVLLIVIYFSFKFINPIKHNEIDQVD